MNGYLVMLNNRPYQVCWTHEQAQKECDELAKFNTVDTDIVDIPIDPVIQSMIDYFKFRGYKFPDTGQAFLFLVSEIGELADRLVQGQSPDWVRNHPEAKSARIQPEVGDVMMMLTALTYAELGSGEGDPIEMMFEKWASKGFSNKA